jgi:hypothetical protein
MDQQQPESRPSDAPLVPNADPPGGTSGAHSAQTSPYPSAPYPDSAPPPPQWQQQQQQPPPPPQWQQQPPPHGYYQPQPIYVTQQVQMAPAAVAAPQKSMAAALLLTFFFGPLGLFYASVTGGVVMTIISIIVAIMTLGFGLFVTGPICMVWAAIATNNENARAAAGAQHYTQNSR